MTAVRIVHLYAAEMNIYGDNGNVQVLRRRLEWRGLPVEVTRVGVGDPLPADTHLLVGGGGQDAGQAVITDDLAAKGPDLRARADDGVPMLLICGMYQMAGHYFAPFDAPRLDGVGLLDVRTEAGPTRLIGNVTSTSDFGTLVGYENHSGLTYLGPDAAPLGDTALGQGNNGTDGTEGARRDNVIGTYLHGPLLAKCPTVADHLLTAALASAGLPDTLEPLDDSLAEEAARVAASRPR
ncbi:MAG: glutamine amidotransferase [Jiangellales bacterium]